MKYISPDSFLDSEDPSTWAGSEERWEEMSERYRAYIRTVEQDFPPGLRRLTESYYLHDALIHGVGRREGAFFFQLRLDVPPRSVLTLTFDLVEPAVIDPDYMPVGQRNESAVPDWQYDEIERVDGDPPTWRMSILLSNGWEVVLHFRDVRVEEYEPLLPALLNGVTSPSVPAPQPA